MVKAKDCQTLTRNRNNPRSLQPDSPERGELATSKQGIGMTTVAVDPDPGVTVEPGKIFVIV
jgi:hypothetical protein